jgi:hypothetical protein
LVIVQPDAAALIPPVPVSWYGVASPFALSGFAGTMMLQLTLVVEVVVAVEVADGDGLAEGLAFAPSAVWLMVDGLLPENASTIAMVTPSTTGMATGTAKRAAQLRPPRRRAADRCPIGI